MSENTATSHVLRLSGLQFFPAEPEAIRELGNALERLGAPERQDEFVSDWLSESRKAPTPSDVRNWGVSHREEAAPLSSEPMCERCGDTGWEEKTKTGIVNGTSLGPVACVQRCGCQK